MKQMGLKYWRQVVLVLCLVIFGVGEGYSVPKGHGLPQGHSVPQSSKKELTISFAGDCTLGSFKGQGYGDSFDEAFDQKGATFFFSNVAPIFRRDDLTIVNLEGPLTDRLQTVVKKFPIRCLSKHGMALKTGFIDVVTLANNHIYDCGEAGFADTVMNLKQLGIGYSAEGEPWLKDVKGFKVACLCYEGWDDTEELRAQITQEIRQMRQQKADIICVYFHFGIERQYIAEQTQVDLAHHAVDMGADVVLGVHPHVLQGIEVYKGKTICYSLGNFSFGANSDPADKDTMIYQATFAKGKQGAVYVRQQVIPCRISSTEEYNDYCPTIHNTSESVRVLGRLREYSAHYAETIAQLRLKQSSSMQK